MDLRRRTIHALAGTGALLIILGLSVGGGVAVADPGPSAQAVSDAAKVNTAASDGTSSDDKSSDKKSPDRKSKRRRSKSDSGGTGSTDSSNSTDPNSGNRSDDSTDTSATTTPPSTATPTTRPTPSTRPTATTAPPTTATTAAPTTASTQPATTGTTTAEPTAGQYNGGEPPYQATEAPTDESSSTTTAPPTRKAQAPASRSGSGSGPGSGSGLSPGIHPIGSGDSGSDPGDPADSGDSSRTPAGVPTGSPTYPPSNTVVPAQSQPNGPTTGARAASGGVSDPATATAPAAEVSGTGTEQVDPGATRHSQKLPRTGDGTRRLILFGGFALLMGAVVVAFSGRENPALATTAIPAGPPRRRARPRRELDGWEDGVPLAPAKRELARNRLGLSADPYYDGEPGV